MAPRSSVKPRTSTPARSTGVAATNTQNGTSTARKSTRNASRQPTATRDIVANPALPEIQTQQSYAYGSSKAPILPDRLYHREMSMQAVVNRLNNAADEAERNFEAQAAEARASSPDSQISARDARATKRASRDVSQKSPRQPLTAETPDKVRKQDRTSAWIESNQLEDITEESDRPESSVINVIDRERADSEPSSFPDGSFNHSYSYERGERGPQFPQPELKQSVERNAPSQSRTHDNDATQPVRQSMLRRPSVLSRIKSFILQLVNDVRDFLLGTLHAISSWISRMFRMMQKSFSEIPDSPITAAFFKTLLMTTALSVCALLFCTIFTRTCNAESTSIVTQSLQRICGQCSRAHGTSFANLNFTSATPNDLNAVISALKQTQKQISQIEGRLSSRIDLSHASHTAETASLRRHAANLETQIRSLQKQAPESDPLTIDGISSPLIPKLNYFSPSSGAVIIPQLTTPTLGNEDSFFYKVLRSAVGVRKTLTPKPITALESWIDEGDCWCASPVSAAKYSSQQGSLRLAVAVAEPIYPTELVIEHFPSLASRSPGVAPREIELWADLTYSVNRNSGNDLNTALSPLASADKGIFGNTKESRNKWARIGTASYAINSRSLESSPPNSPSYEMGADETFRSQLRDHVGEEKAIPHVQRFNVEVNKQGLLHFADRYVVMVKNNHGADHTCLYRVRLHGVSVGSPGEVHE